MSASRLFTLVGASFCRNRLRHHSIPVFLFYLKPPVHTSIKLISSSSSSSLSFPRFSSSADVPLEANSSTTTTITGHDDAEASSVILTDHPWPEWVAFVENLKSKGYFTRNSSTSDVAADGGDDGGGVIDLNSLKFACLNFARDRFDIFKSLSKKEIHALVDKGCPNLFRKAVNSGKRLRAYLQLNEGDVCNVCLLRGSCDRAFYVLKDFEATARTVDIVRLLMLYAIDPMVSSRDVKTPDRVAIEASARKLLTELIELSETERDPHFIDHDEEVIYKKDRQPTYETDEYTEMKRGDWMCPRCNFLNFSRNLRCRKCAEDGPRRAGGNEIEMKKGDWLCPGCKYMNFARNIKCLQCQAEGPKSVSFGERKEGDWDCQKCGFMNFANNVKCKRCQDPRTQGRPGDWECPQCRFWNYARNTSCKKCDKKHHATQEKRYTR